MFQIFKIATLNINAISSKTPLQMVEDFLCRQDLDFALLQEVSFTILNTIRRYTPYMNMVWYKVIHGSLPTNVRLFRIRMVPTDACRKCDRTDTLSHHLIEGGEGKQTWTWTRQRLAWILRTIPERIPSDWLLRPHFTLWPPRRRRAVLWV